MATYQQIFGRHIQFLASDPSASVSLGQIWYNSVSNTYKTTYNPAVWAAGGNLNIARDSMSTAKQGTLTAGLIMGGHTGPGTQRDSVESYNGTGWTAENGMPSARQLSGGAGTQTSALSFGGQTGPPNVISNITQSFDGTNWTTENALGTAGSQGGSSGAGTETAALMFGRNPPVDPTITEEYNGTSWAASPGAMNIPRGDQAGTGLQTAALAIAGNGYPPGTFVTTYSESYDGATWTSEGTLNTARRRAGAAGPSASAVAFGGLVPGPAATTSAETFDGSSWTAAPSLGTGRYYLGGAGASATAALASGGLTTGSATSYTNATEEYAPADTIKTITTS